MNALTTYPDWPVVALAWAALGAICFGVNEFSGRTSGSIPPSQNGFFPALAVIIIVVVGAPLIVLFGVPYMLRTLWKGTNPLTGRHWSATRAKKYGGRLTEESSDTTLSKMVELRWKADGRKQPHPSQTPPAHLWRTPEYIILLVIRSAARLQADGLSEGQTAQKIDTALCLDLLHGKKQGPTVRQYLTQVLETVAPGYLKHGPKLLDNAIALAQRNADYMMRSQEGAYPPKGWLKERIDEHQFQQQFGKRLYA